LKAVLKRTSIKTKEQHNGNFAEEIEKEQWMNPRKIVPIPFGKQDIG
jgi:hypothetical protein